MAEVSGIPSGFAKADWALLLDLLETELRNLPTEIHHTRNETYREQLLGRLNHVNALIPIVKSVIGR